MSKRKPKPIPLFTAKAVVQINANEEKDTRRFFTHEQSVAKNRPRCCIDWDRETNDWKETENPCPEGTHDHIGCSAIVLCANPQKPWKFNRQKKEKAKYSNFLLTVEADGEIARQIYVAPNDSIFMIDGHMTSKRYKGQYWYIFTVLAIKALTEEIVTAHLANVSFSTYRQNAMSAGDRLRSEEPFNQDRLESLNQQRLAGLRSRTR